MLEVLSVGAATNYLQPSVGVSPLIYAIKIKCPECNSKIESGASNFGKLLGCPHCQASIPIPDPTNLSESPAGMGNITRPSGPAASEELTLLKSQLKVMRERVTDLERQIERSAQKEQTQHLQFSTLKSSLKQREQELLDLQKFNEADPRSQQIITLTQQLDILKNELANDRKELSSSRSEAAMLAEQMDLLQTELDENIQELRILQN